MTTNGRGRRIVEISIFAVLLWAVFALPHCPARADRGPDVRTLAISVVAEAGFVSRVDWAAMLHVLGRRAKVAGVDVDHMAKMYCMVWRVDRPRTAWLRRLNLAGVQPDHWPPGARWARHQPQWGKAVDVVRQYLAGRLPDPCKGNEPNHFGGIGDRAPGTWLRACRHAQTKQHYYRSR